MNCLVDLRIIFVSEVKKLIIFLLLLVWLEYGVYGNEIFSIDVLMVMVYYLLVVIN